VAEQDDRPPAKLLAQRRQPIVDVV